MSWQATTWAMNQKVGNAGRKLLLLALANYADEKGFCWPSQGRLAVDTEASLDTIQRQTRKLVAEGFVSIERPPKRRGQWQNFNYRLNMPSPSAKPQNAARPPDGPDTQNVTGSPTAPPPRQAGVVDGGVNETAARLGRTEPATVPQHQAAPGPKPGRTAMRPKPSKENSIEPSGEPSQQQPRAQSKPGAAARRAAWQTNQSVEVIQNRIARRLGSDGWTILMNLGEAELDHVTALERQNRLTDQELSRTVMSALHPELQSC
jgi:Helix-turn-helix domain